MKFIWSEPPNASPGKSPALGFPPIHWEEAILGWLHYVGFWPVTDKGWGEYWKCEYNFVSHFYDISILECRLPGHGEPPDRIIQAMRAYLASSGLDWREQKTWLWDKDKQYRPGVRFWIQAEDFPRKERS